MQSGKQIFSECKICESAYFCVYNFNIFKVQIEQWMKHSVFQKSLYWEEKSNTSSHEI
jgi:hypothetical protein